MRQFKNFAQFAEYLTKLQAQEKSVKKVMLEEVGQHVEDEAKRKFGIYQEADGKFPKWPELEEETKKQRVRLNFEPNNPLYRSGELMHSVSHKVIGDSVYIGSNSDIMVYQEFGTATIPPRPVLGPAMFQARDKIKKIMRGGMALWITGTFKGKVKA